MVINIRGYEMTHTAQAKTAVALEVSRAKRTVRRFAGILAALNATQLEIELARPEIKRMSNDEIRRQERQHGEYVEHCRASA